MNSATDIGAAILARGPQADAFVAMGDILAAPAERDPGKLAMDDGVERYRFGEAEAGAEAFARFLLASGIVRGDRVAFCAPKSGAIVIAILGCMKAGAIYVPVDARMPAPRIAYILQEVQPRVIVGRTALRDALAGATPDSAMWIDVARLRSLLNAPAEHTPLPRVMPEDIAYCLYTSGSTGRPKGVLIQHGAVAFLFRALAEVMPIDADAICMNTSELSFDVHVMDLIFPLHRGATLYMATSPLNPEALLRTIERHRVSYFTAVGSVMTMLANAALFDRCDLSSLRRIMTGAEIISVPTIQRWLDAVPGLVIVNGYGPTEVTVICTAYLIRGAERDRIEPYPIGVPMRDNIARLMNGDATVDTPGVTGELLIGGPQVMKGYWNDPQRTADRIVEIGGERYYRTGDLCSWRADGNLAFHGRADEEVKISGFRVSLSEIGRVMNAAPGIREALAIATVHPDLGRILVACFTAASAESDGDDVFGALQAAIKRELPYYMVPSAYVRFDALPKLTSNKTDRNRVIATVDELLGAQAAGTTRFTVREVVHG